MGDTRVTTRIIKLIYTEERLGRGTDEDPIRLAPTLYTLDGEPICQLDLQHPTKRQNTVSDNLFSAGRRL